MEDREYTNYIENMYDELIIESVENILNVLTDDKLDDRQCLNAVRRAEQEFVRKTNILDRYRDAHYDYTHPEVYSDYLCQDRTEWEELPEIERPKQKHDAPPAPESVNADAMSDEQLYKKLMDGYEDMRAGNPRDAREAFSR